MSPNSEPVGATLAASKKKARKGCLAAGESQLRASIHPVCRKPLPSAHVGPVEREQLLARQLLNLTQGRRVRGTQIGVEEPRRQRRQPGFDPKSNSQSVSSHNLKLKSRSSNPFPKGPKTSVDLLP